MKSHRTTNRAEENRRITRRLAYARRWVKESITRNLPTISTMVTALHVVIAVVYVIQTEPLLGACYLALALCDRLAYRREGR